MILLMWLIAAYGMSQILVYGSIFTSLREGIHKLGDNPFTPFQPIFKFISGLISCMMCTSTWVGFFMGAFVHSPFTEFLGINPIIGVFFDGMLASGGVWVINSIIEWFENK